MANRRVFSNGVTCGAALLAVAALVGACGDDDAGSGAGEAGSVSFVAPRDGDSVAGGVKLQLAAEGVTIEPAGEVRDGAGHFHVVADAGCVEAGDAVARDVDHVHLGQGQSDGAVYLGPGEHELCLQVGDGAHVAQDITDTVTVEVGIEDQAQWCAVVEEVDVRFEEVDTGGEEFTVQQAGYAGIGRLLDQVLAAIDQVDPQAQDDVRSAIERAHEITDAFVDAADLEEAEANLEPIFTSGEPIGSPAAVQWILDNCGVDIDG